MAVLESSIYTALLSAKVPKEEAAEVAELFGEFVIFMNNHKRNKVQTLEYNLLSLLPLIAFTAISSSLFTIMVVI